MPSAFTKSLPAIVHGYRHMKKMRRNLLNVCMVWMTLPACYVSVSPVCVSSVSVDTCCVCTVCVWCDLHFCVSKLLII